MGTTYSVAPTVPAASYTPSNITCSPLSCINAGVNVSLCSYASANQVTGVFLPSDISMANNLLIGPYYEQKCVATGSVVTGIFYGSPTYDAYTNTYDNHYPLDICGVYFNYTSVSGFNIVISDNGGTLSYNNGLNSDVCEYAPTAVPTTAPTFEPTFEPTSAPTSSPTFEPSAPTFEPTHAPTFEPTPVPTAPTFEPTAHSMSSTCDPNAVLLSIAPADVPGRKLHPGPICCPATPNQVIITPGVTLIPNRAFLDCTTLLSIVIPESVTDIAYGAFEGCTSLFGLFVPSSVLYFNLHAIYQANLFLLTLPNRIGTVSHDDDDGQTYAQRGEVGFDGFAVATCPYYPDAQLMTYSTGYIGPSPACMLPASGNCTHPYTLNLSCSQQAVNIVLCLSAPEASCTTNTQCDILGVFTACDTAYSNNLLVPVSVSLQGNSAVYSTGGTYMIVNNKYPFDLDGVVYNSTDYGYSNIYTYGGIEYINHDGGGYRCTAGQALSCTNSDVTTKTPTTANAATTLSAGATAGIISGVLVSIAFVVFLVAFYIIGKRRATFLVAEPNPIARPYVPSAEMSPDFGAAKFGTDLA